MPPAVATSTAAGHDDLIGWLFEVAKQMTAIAIAAPGTWRNLDIMSSPPQAEAV